MSGWCQAGVTADNSVLITNNTSQFRLPGWESDKICSQDAVQVEELQHWILVVKTTQPLLTTLLQLSTFRLILIVLQGNFQRLHFLNKLIFPSLDELYLVDQISLL